MNPLQKYVWLIDTIRYAGKITFKEISEKWKNNKDFSDEQTLQRSTFNRWRDAIFEQFGIIIDCQKTGGYLYYISNPEDIDDNRLKKWMLDSFSVSNLINDNLSLKDRILVDSIPSGREHLAPLLEAMKKNSVVRVTYRPFQKPDSYTFPIEPYCVKLFENRWYVLAYNPNYDDIRLYALDRIEKVEITEATFRLPKDFNANEYFSNNYGIVVDEDVKPVRIVIRAFQNHKNYLKSLPLHHSQILLEEHEEYADFEVYLSPTYDFVTELLHAGNRVEVRSPLSLRKMMKSWISEMFGLYKND